MRHIFAPSSEWRLLAFSVRDSYVYLYVTLYCYTIFIFFFSFLSFRYWVPLSSYSGACARWHLGFGLHGRGGGRRHNHHRSLFP